MVCEKFKTHSQNECKYNYMAMISINHTKNILKIPLFYYTHMVISGLCEQVKSLKKGSPGCKMCVWGGM